jgi:hypothetical protein
VSAPVWLELHTDRFDAAAEALATLGFGVEEADLAELGRAARLHRDEGVWGGLIESTEAGGPAGWVPFHIVDALPPRSWWIPPLALPGGTRALSRDGEGRPEGFWVDGPTPLAAVVARGPGWAAQVPELPVGPAWSDEGAFRVHRTGWAVVLR